MRGTNFFLAGERLRNLFSFGNRSFRAGGIALGLVLANSTSWADGKLIRPTWSIYNPQEEQKTLVGGKPLPSLDALFRKLWTFRADPERAPHALEVYVEMLQRFGDSLILVPIKRAAEREVQNYVRVNRYVQEAIGSQPALLKLFRDRFDQKAESLYQQAVKEQSIALAREVVDKYFASSWGDDALELLGDLYLDAGKWEQAIEAYRRLVPSRFRDPLSVQHITPSVNPAMVRAKRIVAEEALGRRESGFDEKTLPDLRQFQEVFAGENGKFLGREDRPILDSLKDTLREDNFKGEGGRGDWRTFAGDNDRNRLVRATIRNPELLQSLAIGVYQPLTSTTTRVSPVTVARTPAVPRGTASIVPVVEGERLWTFNENRIQVYDLRISKKDLNLEKSWNVGVVGGLGVYSMTVVNSVAYLLTANLPPEKEAVRPVKTGSVVIQNGKTARVAALTAYALDKDNEPLWTKRLADFVPPPAAQPAPAPAPVPARPTYAPVALAQGAPLSDGKSVFFSFVVRAMQAAEEKVYILSLNAKDGSLLWLRRIGDRKIGGPGFGVVNQFGSLPNEVQNPRRGTPILTLEGGVLYYAPNNGMVAALDAETGVPWWVTFYSSSPRENGSVLSPAISYDGMVVLSPTDNRHCFSLRADTGKLVWMSPSLSPTEFNRMIGIHHEKVFFTGTDSVSAVDLNSGYLKTRSLRKGPDLPFPEIRGNSLLAGNEIWIPVSDGLQVRDQQTLELVDAGLKSDPVTPGDLMATKQFLISVTGRELNAYTYRNP